MALCTARQSIWTCIRTNLRTAAFLGMITNIDDNVGKTRDLLKRLGIYENTIFIFTTDNGTAFGKDVYNAGMRGRKGVSTMVVIGCLSSCTGLMVE